MSTFPLCESAGLSIRNDVAWCDKQGYLFNFDAVPARAVEALLRSAPVVYGHPELTNNAWTERKGGIDTHSARVLLVEEIRRDSAESLLYELMENANETLTTEHILKVAFDVAKRARKLLGEEPTNGG